MDFVVDVVIYFMIFSVCGWICESVFCSIIEKKPVNRGFLNGPFCPVYGFGGLIVVYLLGPLRGRYIALFLWGMVACTVLEYITSWLLEKLFNAKWWDYSHMRFNINGRVCLLFSLIFGVLSVVAAELIYPPFFDLVGRIPMAVKGWLALGMALILTADCAATVRSIIELNGKLAEIKKAMDELRQRLELPQMERVSFAQLIERFKADGKEEDEPARNPIQQALSKLEKLTAKKQKFQHKRLLKAFPNMKSTKYQEQFAKLRESLAELGNKIRKN
jgi:uncharacterized membrane protein